MKLHVSINLQHRVRGKDGYNHVTLFHLPLALGEDVD